MEISRPEIRENEKEPSSPEYASWKRLQLCKSKLANVSHVAGVLAGFAIVTTVELQINKSDVSPGLLTSFSVVTALLVATTGFSMATTSLILPYIRFVGTMDDMSLVNLSPHEKMIWFIDFSWFLTTTASLVLFTLDLIIMCWIKLRFFSVLLPILATMILGPVLISIIIMGIIFYRKLIKQKVNVYKKDFIELDNLQRKLENLHSSSTASSSSINNLPPFQPIVQSRNHTFLKNNQRTTASTTTTNKYNKR